MEKHWTIGGVGFIIYSVLVSLRTEAIFWGKREFGKENRGDAMKQMFYGGVHPAEHKEATEQKPIQPLANAPRKS